MSLSRSEETAEQALKELRPKRNPEDLKNLSDHKVEDEFFNKEKQYYDTKDNPKTVRADWRNFNIGKLAFTAYLNQPITKEQLKAMKSDPDAVDFYLVKVKSKKAEAKNDK